MVKDKSHVESLGTCTEIKWSFSHWISSLRRGTHYNMNHLLY